MEVLDTELCECFHHWHFFLPARAYERGIQERLIPFILHFFDITSDGHYNAHWWG